MLEQWLQTKTKLILPIKWKEKLIAMLIPYGHFNLDFRLKSCAPKIAKLFKCKINFFRKWKNHQIRQDLTLNKASLDWKTHIGIFWFVEQIYMLHHTKIEWKIFKKIYKWKNPYYRKKIIIFKIMLKVKRRIKATRRLNGNYTTNLLNYMMSFFFNKNLSIWMLTKTMKRT